MVDTEVLETLGRNPFARGPVRVRLSSTAFKLRPNYSKLHGIRLYGHRLETYSMAKNEKTSKSVASKASKILSDPKSTKAQKSVAASALTQAPSKKKTK